MESITVPFSARYSSTGLEATGVDILSIGASTTLAIGAAGVSVDVRGLARLTPEALVLEYRATRVRVMGVNAAPANTDLRQVTIPLNAVDSVQWKTGLLRKPRLIVHFSRLDLAPDLPWSDTTQLVLHIDRRDLERGRELLISIRMHLADAELRRLGE